MERRSLTSEKDKGGGLYFASPSPDLSFISSGSALLDCVLGGGWALGRMENIIGDKSTAKTGLTIEAMASFAARYPKGKIFHREAESAFDASYGKEMGYPADRVIRWEDDHDEPLDTVEDIYEDLEKICSRLKQPALYIVDSWDSLSDRAEMKRKIDEGSYGGNKQKQAGQLFRRLCRKLHKTQICLMIVSQVRDVIGVTFGERHRRSGGKALDFYASHCLWLANAGKIKEKLNGQNEVTAIQVKARCKKNKIGLPFKECVFTYRFGWGIDDIVTCAEWLNSIGVLNKTLGYRDVDSLVRDADKLDKKAYRELAQEIGKIAQEAWSNRQAQLLPKRRKYE